MNEEHGGIVVHGNYYEIKNNTFYGGVQHFGKQADDADGEETSPHAFTDDELTLRQRLDIVTKMMCHGRHWFSICKAMMEGGDADPKDFRGAAGKIIDAYEGDEMPYPINPEDIARLDALSMSKDIQNWDENDAPVTGNKFFQYKAIALAMLGTYGE